MRATRWRQVAGLLDTKDGGVYVFAGQDTANPPVPDPDAILHPASIPRSAARSARFPANGAAATTAATLAIASSNAAGTSPFSAYLSQPAALSAALDGRDRRRHARCRPACWQAPTPTSLSTGHIDHRLLHARPDARAGDAGLAVQRAGDDPGFAALVQDTATSLNGAVTRAGGDAGVMGDRQAGADQHSRPTCPRRDGADHRFPRRRTSTWRRRCRG